MVKVQIKKLNSKVKLPKYKTDGSSGVDLHAFLAFDDHIVVFRHVQLAI